MRLLLDTHVLLWWLADDRKLRRATRELIGSVENEVLVSSASLWEIAIKAGLNRIESSWTMSRPQFFGTGSAPCLSDSLTQFQLDGCPLFTATRLTECWSHRRAWKNLRIVSHDRIFEKYGLTKEGIPPTIV